MNDNCNCAAAQTALVVRKQVKKYPLLARSHSGVLYDRRETWSEDNPDGRWQRFTAQEILNRDKNSLDIFWIKDKALADLDNLPAPEELAEDILENLQSAMDGFGELLAVLKQ